MSSPLFFPDEGPARGRRRRDPIDLDSEVDQLVSAALQTPPLSRSMQRFLNSYPNFSRLISRHVRVLSQRRSDFAAGEMTIFDKALLAITRHGADVHSVAAILFYCWKWCEYDPVIGAPTETMHDMAQIATLPWDCACNRSDRRPEPPRAPASSVSNVNQGRPRNDEALTRLLGVYEEAIQDFQTVEHLKNDKTEGAARYLRDTAENALLLLKDTNIDPRKLHEIEQTYEITKRFVQDMSGKIRKFDPGWRPLEPPNEKAARSAYSRHRHHQQRQVYETRQSVETHIKTEDDTMSQSDHALGMNTSPQDTYQARPARDPNAYSYRVEDTAQRRRSRSPSRDECHTNRQRDAGAFDSGIRVKGNGNTEPRMPPSSRGHSGIPYGYGDRRVVDSYRPGA